MPRPAKYEEPTVQVSLRLPTSVVEWLDHVRGSTSRADAIVRMLQDWDTKPVTPPEVKVTNLETSSSGCAHPKSARLNLGYAVKCTQCGAVL